MTLNAWFEDITNEEYGESAEDFASVDRINAGGENMTELGMRERVVEGLECYQSNDCDICPYSIDEWTCDKDGLKASALALLKAQEPVKPEWYQRDEKTLGWYKCGNCGMDMGTNPRYCGFCGRKVKWE